MNHQLQNEVSKANFNTCKRIYNWPPFMKVVYADLHIRIIPDLHYNSVIRGLDGLLSCEINFVKLGMMIEEINFA